MRETATNGDGVYALSNLPPGTYEVSFKATGFDEKKTAVTLQVGQSVTADAELGVSVAAEVDCLDCGADLVPLVDTAVVEG